MATTSRKSGKRSITTSQLALLSGVSRSTVSAVLNGKRTVRESTRRKVLDCIRQKRYESGMIARALVGELSRMVAVLASDLGSPFHMMFFRGVNEVLGSEGYHLLFHNVRPEDQADPDTLATLHAYRPAGYIVLRGAQGPHGEHARAIAEEGVPLVCHGYIENLETHMVNFDNRLAMRIAADHVIEQGHRRLVHLSGPAYSMGAKDRQLGFIESVIAHDIPMSDAQVVRAGEKASDGYRVALEVLRDPDARPTALVCFNDMVAMGAYRAAHEFALDIPGDLSVVGMDGLDFAELLGPPLTSVDIFPKLLGKKAAELLIRAIRNETGRGVVSEWVEPELVQRKSVRRLDEPTHFPR